MDTKRVFIKAKQVLLKQKAVLAILAMLILMLFFNTQFYSVYNWMNVFRSATVQGIIAMGVTMTVLCAACDLSVGGIMCLSGVITVLMINSGMPIAVACLCALLAGAAVGLVNGFLVVHQRTEPFIITLGMGTLLKGICQQLTDAHPIACTNMEFMKISNTKIFGQIPILVLYMAVILVIFFCVLRFTTYGRNCYAIGGNYDVAKYSGINTVMIKWSTFVISGVMAALAGILLSYRMNSASSVYGDNTGMLVNCGVVIGGTSFAGGIGGVVQSFIGVFVLQLMSNCMDCLGIGAYVQQLLQGIIIVLILGFDCFGRLRKREHV